MTKMLVIAAVSIFPLTGCLDLCEPGTDKAYCDGAILVSCPQPGVDQMAPDHWIRSECLATQTCVVPESGHALCAMGEEPDPRCVEGASSVCADAATELFCSQGYATGTIGCLTCTDPVDDEPAQCEGGFGAYCERDEECGEVCKDGYCT